MSSRNSGSKSGTSKRNADANSNMGFDVEQQFILRLPAAPAARLASDIEAGVSMKDRLGLAFNQDMRHITIHYGAKKYPGKLVDLPCIVESLKTTDKKVFYKTGDICQLLICREEEEEEEERRKQAEADLSPRKKEKMAEKQFVHNHGITPPLKNVRKKRFRKTMKKKFLDMPEIEKEVKRLLRVDLEAREVKWEVVFEDEQQQTVETGSSKPCEDSQATAATPATAAAAAAAAAATKGASSAAKTSEIFGYLSSDEEEEEKTTQEAEAQEAEDGSILERACRMVALTEEDLRPFTAAAERMEAGDVGDTMADVGEEEARLQERIVELTAEIERLKAFINVRESQLPNLEHEKFRERLQMDIDSYNEQLSECRREFERLSGQLEMLARNRSG